MTDPVGPVIRGAILAGGKASRFGGKLKGLEKVGGERILDRTAAAVRAATGGFPILVANDADAVNWHESLTVVRDIRLGCGSLGGIYTALMDGTGPVLVVAWDMPFVTAALLGELVRRADGYDVYLPESNGPLGWEPLCAVYGPNCVGPIEECLEHQNFQTGRFHENVRTGFLPREEVQRFGNLERVFFNVNTQNDVRKAEVLWNRPCD